MLPDHDALQPLIQRHKALAASGGQDAFSLRMHRALSWLSHAQTVQAAGDDDMAFICQWIAFNAAYAQDLQGLTEKAVFTQFMQRICDLDQQASLYNLLWHTYAGPVRTLLGNRYVFQPFWDQLNTPASQSNWQTRFQQANQKAHKALSEKDTASLLQTVFVRLYTLRNQLMHGGATWASSVNRAQVRDGRALLGSLLPAMLAVMIEHPQHFQAPPFYPVVGD